MVPLVVHLDKISLVSVLVVSYISQQSSQKQEYGTSNRVDACNRISKFVKFLFFVVTYSSLEN